MTSDPQIHDDKIVADAIFGFITLKPHIVDIIDTPEFQRFRWLWQLGLTAFVYPTADHTRFEHSIGTYWLASKLVTKIQKQLQTENAEIEITDKDVVCVEIAALLHDIGHGPFSHTWEKVLKNCLSPEQYTKHEDQFKNIWKIFKENNKFNRMISSNDIREEDELLIERLIRGKNHPGKEVLSYIVSNSKSGMDVDKWDYLARDANYLGHASTNYRADIERLIHFARAVKGDDGTWEIAFRDTEALNLIRVYQLRHHLYQTAYLHKTVMIIEQMFVDGIKRCIEINILNETEIGTAKWILQNTDGILFANSSRIEEFKRILDRELYKPIAVATKNGIIEDPSKGIIQLLLDKNIDTTTIRVLFCQFKLGNNDANPIDNIRFYKGRDKFNPYKFDPLPSKLNINVDETKVLVVSTISEDFGYVESILKTGYPDWNFEKV